MRNDREKAVALRQQGKSYAEITKKLGIPKATLSGWFRDQPWSILVRDSLSTPSRVGAAQKIKKMAAVNRQRWQAWRQSAQTQAEEEFTILQKNPLFLPAIILYWSQGDLSPESSVVRFSSNDFDMTKLFFSFLSKTVKADKISCRLYLYPGLAETVHKNLWSKATGIPSPLFRKSVVVSNKARTKQKSFGICTIYVHSRQLKEKMLKWLELTKAELA
ncbi:MAG: helix-turn-helix domain-containing protein [bacterium]|nr:helix-turn-helix domain-containing protein [bacterium]